MMAMYFHFGVEESAILFHGWRTTDVNGIVGSVIGIIMMAAIHEGLKNYREHLFVKSSIRNQRSGKKFSRKEAIFSGLHLLQTFLHVIQLIIGYFLMFIFMTFNVWLALGVVIGTALGYWLFAWDRHSIDKTECCI